MNDNDGTTDQHRAIGEGNIPFRDVCNALNEYAPNAIWAVETQTSGLNKSYDWLKESGSISSPV